MLHVSSPSSCNVTYTAISDSPILEAQQTISIDNCRTIYVCWFVFENESVCLYHQMTSGIPAKPNEQLYLAVMTVEEGNWVLLPYPNSVFTPGQYPGTISSSVGLYGIIDDESDSKAAEFLIGKGRYVHRVKLLFLSSPAERRFTKVCDTDHRVIHVSATKHDVLVVCDNKVYWIRIGKWWKPAEVTPPELTEVTFTGASVNCFISESSDTSIGLIAQNMGGNTEYCFIGRQSQHTMSHCGVISNASLSHGIFNTSDDTQFLTLLDGDVGVISMSSNDSYETIGIDFCYTQDNCLLVLTKSNIYIGNEQKTTILDRKTFGVFTTRNVSVYEMLLMIERQLVESPSPTSTIPLTSITVRNSSAIIQTTTTSPVSISSTSTLKSITASTSTTGDISSGSGSGITTASKINVPHTSTSAVTSINVNVTTNSTTGTRSEPSRTNIVETPSVVDDATANNTANNSEIDTKSEFSALNIIIGIPAVLGLFILILLAVIIIAMLVARHYKMKSLGFVHREKIEKKHQGQELSQMDAVQSQSDSGKPGGEVVMTPTDIEMYELASANTSKPAVTQTTGNTNTRQKVLV